MSNLMELINQEVNHCGVTNTHMNETGDIIIASSYDATALIEKNKQAQNSGNNGYFNKEKEMRLIGEIDMVTVHRLLVEHNINVLRGNPEDMKRFKQWLRQPENRHFTTVRPGSF